MRVNVSSFLSLITSTSIRGVHCCLLVEGFHLEWRSPNFDGDYSLYSIDVVGTTFSCDGLICCPICQRRMGKFVGQHDFFLVELLLQCLLDRLVHFFDLVVHLQMAQWGESLANLQIFAYLSDLCIIELIVVVGYDEGWYSVATFYRPPHKICRVGFGDLGERFLFYQLSEIVHRHYRPDLLSQGHRKLADDIQPVVSIVYYRTWILAERIYVRDTSHSYPLLGRWGACYLIDIQQSVSFKSRELFFYRVHLIFFYGRELQGFDGHQFSQVFIIGARGYSG